MSFHGRSLPALLLLTSALCVLMACAPGREGGSPTSDPRASVHRPPSVELRVAVFNIWELGREKLDQVDEEGRGSHPQLRHAAEVIQRLRPDILLVNEIDYDTEERNATLFVERYLRHGEGGQQPIDYPHIFFASSNTGEASGLDLDNDGETGGPADAWGFGRYPGQYGMALLSRWPIDREAARTFRLLRWADMPGHLMPDGRDGRPPWHDSEEASVVRLSSKSHWDVPVRIEGHVLHLLASHPTPPVFDGDEDLNGRRNFDEIRLWADYLNGGERAAYLVDDQGRGGGLADGVSFVLLGDLNADHYSGATDYGRTAISQLLEHPRIRDPRPRGPGGAAVERPYTGPPEERTSSYGRIDYALPSRDLVVRGSGVFWPAPGDPLAYLVEGEERSSDHRAVWVDVTLGPATSVSIGE